MLQSGHGNMCHILQVSLQSHGWMTWRYRSRSKCITHFLMPVIICAKYAKNPTRTVDAVEWTHQDVPYFSSLLQSHGWMTSKIKVKVIIQNCKEIQSRHAMQDRQTDGVKPIYPSPTTTLLCRGYQDTMRNLKLQKQVVLFLPFW